MASTSAGPPGISGSDGEPAASEKSATPPSAIASMSSQAGGAQPGPPEIRPFATAGTAIP